MTPRLLIPILSLAALCAQTGKKPVTLDSISAAPRGTAGAGFAAAVWAPDGERFVYQNGGKLWLYQAGTQAKKEIASIDAMQAGVAKAPAESGPFGFENRRVSEERTQWSADGKSLLLILSGDLFFVDVESGKWTQLTTTPEAEKDAKLSPDAKMVSFRRGNELYVMDIAGKAVRQLTHDSSATIWNARLDWVYPEELDLGTAHWWSPDSSSIAYLQFDVGRQMIYPHSDLLPVVPVAEPQRYPKAGAPNADVRLGVVKAAGGATKWMDLGETRDMLLARVNWLPDSKSVAAQRVNRVQNRLDLLVADVKTGESSLLLQETDPAWVNVSSDLRFLKDGKRFLWTSERSGFRHIYLYSMQGKVLRQLSKGEWEVSQISGVDEQGGFVYYVSTENSPLERRLYRVKLDGKNKQALTTAVGTHSVSLSPGCRYYMDSHSSMKQPSRRTLHNAEGKELAVLEEVNWKPYEDYELLPSEILTVKAADGATLYAKLTRPAGFSRDKKYPVIVMVYGGPHSQTVRDAWSGLTWEQALAHKGFVIWQLDNRGSSGRGHAWESKLYRRLGKQELEDQKAGVAHLLSMGFADPARVGIYGWSYGGFMTLYSLLNASEVFRVGIAGAPVTDWRNYDTIYTERYLGLPQENEEGYRASSPVNQAADLKGKLMIVHNFEDDNVLFQNSMQMTAALERAGKLFDLMIYPGKSHGVMGPARKHLNAMMTDFFERSLAAK